MGDGENERMMANRKLGVVGNQMAGVGAVEEMRSPGGERFHVMMLGAEPHGNDDRLLLSGILSGAQDTSEGYIHPLQRYERNNVRLHAGAPAGRIDRSAKVAVSEIESPAGVRSTRVLIEIIRFHDPNSLSP
jgi:nitrite reductase (NADH) large subunit